MEQEECVRRVICLREDLFSGSFNGFQQELDISGDSRGVGEPTLKESKQNKSIHHHCCKSVEIY